MNKEQLVSLIKGSVARGELSKEDIRSAYEEVVGEVAVPKAASPRNISVAEVLYYVGGLIVLVGIVVLIVQNWEGLNSFVRILIALGSGIVLYTSAVLLSDRQNLKKIAQIFFGLSMVLLPIGLLVLFHELSFDVGDSGTQSVIAALMIGIAGASLYMFRNSLFIAFTIAFATWLYYSFSNYVLQGITFFYDSNIYQYLTMILGLAYIFLGHYFSSKSEEYMKSLTGKLYGLGLIAFLGAAVSLDGIWELLFPGIAFGVLFFSVYLRSRAFLWLGSLFLMVYIIKITAKYFGEGLGWPLALVLAGLALIGVGYATFYLNKKYITGNEGVQS